VVKYVDFAQFIAVHLHIEHTTGSLTDDLGAGVLGEEPVVCKGIVVCSWLASPLLLRTEGELDYHQETPPWPAATTFDPHSLNLLYALLTIPLVCCHINSFRRASGGGEAMARRRKEERWAGLTS